MSVAGAWASGSPLYELIYGVLREHIDDGSFPRGLVLGEAAVARAFQASRVPAAMALRRLREDGLIADFEGRGYLANPGKKAVPIRRNLQEAGLRLPAAVEAGLTLRNRRQRIYPDVEHTVAASLSYGRFLLNESALAEHYRVSRTVAHEILTRLERTGLVVQDVNQRWYAGPLTTDLLREHYEMRWLLEPIALGQVIPELDTEEIAAKERRAERNADGRMPPKERELLERDLHVDIVLRCRNRQLRETIRRSQLPLIATHSTFERFQHQDEIVTMVAEHVAILGHLRRGRGSAAMRALGQHLKRSLQPNIELLERLGPLPEALQRPYLLPADSEGIVGRLFEKRYR
jgi:DNA-binding GntR family transcriptional regulator